MTTPRDDDAVWFRDTIEGLWGGNAQTSLSRFLILCGDRRELTTIRRSVGNYARGASPLLPEMRAMLTVLAMKAPEKAKLVREASEPPRKPKPWDC